MSLCLGLGGLVWAVLPLQNFTLAWNHTIEHIRWEEDYSVQADGLKLEEARVLGNGAGMEIPPDAVFNDGVWHYRRELPPLQPLRLARTPEAGDYELCFDDQCRQAAYWLGAPSADEPALDLWSCATPRIISK